MHYNDRYALHLTSSGREAAELWDDFNHLCDFGGRLLGTSGERDAIEWVSRRLAEIKGVMSLIPFQTTVWVGSGAKLVLEDSTEIACQPMLRSASTPQSGLYGNIIDLGIGRPNDFERCRDIIPGQIVLVEHEYPFSPDHVHRRRKIELAIRHGATGLLMTNPLSEGGLLSGSSQSIDGFEPIACAYITREAALGLRESGKSQTAHLFLEGRSESLSSSIVQLQVGDSTRPQIVISAHIDGHPLGESAMDNASGVAVALAAGRCLAPIFANSHYGLKVMIFTAEEWALYGSECYLKSASKAERENIKLNINLDTVSGSPDFTALISGFPELAQLITRAAEASNLKVATYVPLMGNSDHYNFAKHGIPAFRLLAGFGQPDSRVQHILSAQDTRDKVDKLELVNALRFTCAAACVAVDSQFGVGAISTTDSQKPPINTGI